MLNIVLGLGGRAIAGNMQSSDWYVARILTGKEKIIEFCMKRQNITVFFPTAVELRPGQRHPSCVRLFPGYAFFQFDAANDWWYDINNTHGVIHLLPVKHEQPLHLPRATKTQLSFVDALKTKIMEGGFSPKQAEDLALKYVPGDLVPITTGTYAGFEGQLVKSNKDSLTLLMAMFGRQMEVPVPRACVA